MNIFWCSKGCTSQNFTTSRIWHEIRSTNFATLRLQTKSEVQWRGLPCDPLGSADLLRQERSRNGATRNSAVDDSLVSARLEEIQKETYLCFCTLSNPFSN